MDERDVPVTLFSPNHNDALSAGLWQQFKSKRGVDFDLGWGLKAHRCVLEVFLSPEQLTVFEVKLPNDTLNAILEFLYTGSVAVSRKLLPGMLLFARNADLKLLVGAISTAFKKSSGMIQQPVRAVPQVLPTAVDATRRPPRPSNPEKCPRQQSGIRSEPVRVTDTTWHGDDGYDVSSYANLCLPVIDETTPIMRIKREPSETCDQEEILPDLPRCESVSMKAGSVEQLEEDNPVEIEVDSTEMLAKEEAICPPVSTDSCSQVDRVATPNAGDYNCDKCGRIFKRRGMFMIHYRKHTGERPFSCGVCGETFVCKAGMLAHRRAHLT